jgi:hypothetical protein
MERNKEMRDRPIPTRAEFREKRMDENTPRPQDRVRELTDIKTDGNTVLKNQFNITQRLRLEGAGEIQTRKEERKEKIQNFITSKKVAWAEKKVMLGEKRLERVSEKTDGIIAKLNAGIMKLEKVDARIQTFINEETSPEIVTALNDAHLLLETAQSSVVVVRIELLAQVQTEDGTSFEAIKSLVAEALGDLRAAWTAYEEVVVLTKGDITQNN